MDDRHPDSFGAVPVQVLNPCPGPFLCCILTGIAVHRRSWHAPSGGNLVATLHVGKVVGCPAGLTAGRPL